MILEFLEDRKKKVLQIIVEDYIDSAEPVGSKAVTERHGVEASSATIRFDMAELEKRGYIKKPHTSAGRVPSDKGYRFFIDNIMQAIEISKAEERRIKEVIAKVEAERSAMIDAVGDLLSALCGNTSLLLPSERQNNVNVCGISKIVKQPEFNMSNRLCQVVETLEQHSLLMEILSRYVAEGENEISIHVGEENPFEQLKQCSIAAIPFKDQGIIGVVGPTRMDYERVSSVLKCFSKMLEETEL